METRIAYLRVAPGAYKAMLGLEEYLHQCGLEETLIHLIKLRTSQVNGCAFCIDMHWKDLRALGESEQRLYGLDAWEESPSLAVATINAWNRLAISARTEPGKYQPVREQSA